MTERAFPPGPRPLTARLPHRIPDHPITVEEFLAWVPSYERGFWELIEGVPRWRGWRLRINDIAARSTEEVVLLLDAVEEQP